MKLNEELALFLLDKHQPRRKRLLENLLVGKKTVATIYWALRYQILGYLGLGRYMEITKLDFNNLEKQKLVIKDENQAYVLTDKGYILRSKILGDNLKARVQEYLQEDDLVGIKYNIEMDDNFNVHLVADKLTFLSHKEAGVTSEGGDESGNI